MNGRNQNIHRIDKAGHQLATQRGAPDRDFYLSASLGMFVRFKNAALLSLGAYQKRMQTRNVPEPRFHNL